MSVKGTSKRICLIIKNNIKEMLIMSLLYLVATGEIIFLKLEKHLTVESDLIKLLLIIYPIIAMIMQSLILKEWASGKNNIFIYNENINGKVKFKMYSYIVEIMITIINILTLLLYIRLNILGKSEAIWVMNLVIVNMFSIKIIIILFKNMLMSLSMNTIVLIIITTFSSSPYFIRNINIINKNEKNLIITIIVVLVIVMIEKILMSQKNY
jgi:hypothetical protein